MAVPMGEITRALVGVRRRLCVKWGFVDMDVYEQEYRFYWCAYGDYYVSYGDSSYDAPVEGYSMRLANSEYCVNK